MLKPSDVFLIWVISGLVISGLLAWFLNSHTGALVAGIPFWIGICGEFVHARKRAKLWKKMHGDTRGL
jgi:hypothetical protein